MKGFGVDLRTPTFFDSGIDDWGRYTCPAVHAGVPGLMYCLVWTGISSRSITDLTKQPSSTEHGGTSAIFIFMATLAL